MGKRTVKRLRKAGFSKLSAKYMDEKVNGKKRKKKGSRLRLARGSMKR